jgi:hypothetical protein
VVGAPLLVCTAPVVVPIVPPVAAEPVLAPLLEPVPALDAPAAAPPLPAPPPAPCANAGNDVAVTNAIIKNVTFLEAMFSLPF